MTYLPDSGVPAISANKISIHYRAPRRIPALWRPQNTARIPSAATTAAKQAIVALRCDYSIAAASTQQINRDQARVARMRLSPLAHSSFIPYPTRATALTLQAMPLRHRFKPWRAAP